MLLIAGGGAPSHFHCWLEGGPFILPLLAIGGWSPFILPLLAGGGGCIVAFICIRLSEFCTYPIGHEGGQIL